MLQNLAHNSGGSGVSERGRHTLAMILAMRRHEAKIRKMRSILIMMDGISKTCPAVMPRKI